MKNKLNRLLYSMCLSLNAIAMQSEGFDQANTPSNLVHQAAANASGVTSPGTPVSLDRLMAMMLSMQNCINVDGAAIGELRDTIEKQNATIEKQNATIGELRAKLAQQNTTIGELRAELAQQNTTIGELRAELAQQNTTIGELRADLRAAERRFTEMNILLESWK